mmetsp:Transcript_9205/g.27724  ORF Transcript_9205/g.27724 Transcript_9205/m.27724 type:complete len:155 (+) Transcript_9205:87-551(+)
MEQGTGTDPVTILQQKLDEFSVMMYSYVGILQRDAAPVVAPKVEGAEENGDEQTKATGLSKEELQKQAVEFANNIVKAAVEIDERIEVVDSEVESQIADIESRIKAADEQARSAGKELKLASSSVRSRLDTVRKTFEEIEKEDDERKASLELLF